MDRCSIVTAQNITLAAAAAASLIASALTATELSLVIAFLNALTTSLATVSVTGSTLCQNQDHTHEPNFSEAQTNSAEIASPGTSDILSDGNSNGAGGA